MTVKVQRLRYTGTYFGADLSLIVTSRNPNAPSELLCNSRKYAMGGSFAASSRHTSSARTDLHGPRFRRSETSQLSRIDVGRLLAFTWILKRTTFLEPGEPDFVQRNSRAALQLPVFLKAALKARFGPSKAPSSCNYRATALATESFPRQPASN